MLAAVVGLAAFFGWQGQIPGWVLVWGAVAFVALALLQANYDRHAALEERPEGVTANLDRVAAQYRDSTHWMVAVDALLHVHMNGALLLNQLLDSMKSEEGSRPALRSRVDEWESQADRTIEKWCDASELDSYRRPLAPVVLTGDWKQDLFEQLSVRLGRVHAIQTRKREAWEAWLESV